MPATLTDAELIREFRDSPAAKEIAKKRSEKLLQERQLLADQIRLTEMAAEDKESARLRSAVRAAELKVEQADSALRDARAELQRARQEEWGLHHARDTAVGRAKRRLRDTVPEGFDEAFRELANEWERVRNIAVPKPEDCRRAAALQRAVMEFRDVLPYKPDLDPQAELTRLLAEADEASSAEPELA